MDVRNLSNMAQTNKIKNAVFLGSKALGLRVLQSIVDAAPDIYWTVLHGNDRHDERSIAKDFSDYCAKKNIEFVVVGDAKETRQEMARCKPDIAFACGWYWLLDNSTLEMVPHGIYGMHNSLLPKYRGSAPLVWAIMAGESRVGISLFRFSQGMDDGVIAARFPVSVGPHETIAQILQKLENKCVAELPAVWQQLLSGAIKFEIQDEAQATYCGPRNPNDGMVNWQQTATQIHNFIRAQAPPYPGAFTMVGEQKVILLSSRVFEHPYMGTPGQILMRGHPEVTIACGQNTALIVDKVQMAQDRQHTSPRKIFNSIHLRLSGKSI